MITDLFIFLARFKKPSNFRLFWNYSANIYNDLQSFHNDLGWHSANIDNSLPTFGFSNVGLPENDADFCEDRRRCRLPVTTSHNLTCLPVIFNGIGITPATSRLWGQFLSICPFGSSSLFFISAHVVSSIGLLYSFTDLSRLYMYSIVILHVSIVVSTCSLCIGFELFRWYLPHLAICRTLSVLHVTSSFFAVYFSVVLPGRCILLVHGRLFTSHTRLYIQTLHCWLS